MSLVTGEEDIAWLRTIFSLLRMIIESEMTETRRGLQHRVKTEVLM